MADQQTQPETVPAQTVGTIASSSNEPPVGGREIAMADGMTDTPSPASLLPNYGVPVGRNSSRTGTPVRHSAALGERLESSSRAASAHPEPNFSVPSEAPPNGAPVRQYINSKVTGPLLDGMKLIAKEQPRDPLRVLGEYLLQRSRDLEGPN